MKRDVRLGFVMGSGDPVVIPVRHMCIAGQTQEAGKTTALEGLITRSGLRAVTFITKRGEGSFRGARRIDPFFREQADWQFVASILEASRGEKLKFERAWIIRASKGARTLADVQRNVRKAMKDAKGLSADVYLTLDAYLDAVVPSIERTKFAKTVDLKAGVNVMDLTVVPSEMQHLVIKSTLDWILEHAEDTVVVIPEAWKFIPQGRNTPVKLAAEAFIRQAAGLKNYLWLDSQDIGGIEKTILRSVPVWVLGVQREANEIKRTLENLPATVPQLKAKDIASLELGQFYACFGKHAILTYAQPAWLDDHFAQRVALGLETAADAAQHFAPRALHKIPITVGVLARNEDEAKLMAVTEAVNVPAFVNAGDDEMTPEQERKLDAVLTGQSALIDRIDKLLSRPWYMGFDKASPDRDANVAREVAAEAPLPGFPVGGAESLAHPQTPAQDVDDSLPEDPMEVEAFYQKFKERLIGEIMDDPKILSVLATRPEIQVTVRRETIKVDGSTLPGMLAMLLSEGFFREPKAPGTVTAELMARGAGNEIKINMGRQLQKLNEMGFLRREGKTSDTKYVEVPGMRVNVLHE